MSKVGGAGQTIRVKPKVVKEKGPKVAVSWGFVSMIAGAVLVVGIVLAIIFGPVRAKHQFDPMAEKAESDVRDVVTRGLEFGIGGRVHEVHLLWDMMVMSLPELIHFKGTTSEGEYTGTYNTKTLEVIADLEIGGVVVPGAGEAARHGTSKMRVNGWNRDGEFKVWVNGRPAEYRSRSATRPSTRESEPGLGDEPEL